MVHWLVLATATAATHAFFSCINRAPAMTARNRRRNQQQPIPADRVDREAVTPGPDGKRACRPRQSLQELLPATRRQGHITSPEHRDHEQNDHADHTYYSPPYPALWVPLLNSTWKQQDLASQNQEKTPAAAISDPLRGATT